MFKSWIWMERVGKDPHHTRMHTQISADGFTFQLLCLSTEDCKTNHAALADSITDHLTNQSFMSSASACS